MYDDWQEMQGTQNVSEIVLNLVCTPTNYEASIGVGQMLEADQLPKGRLNQKQTVRFIPPE
jgi:hypothetical protein